MNAELGSDSAAHAVTGAGGSWSNFAQPGYQPALQFSTQNPTFRISLIGMPGAGKTTLGRALAARYELPFCDLDEEIVRRAGRSIPELFAIEGEAGFRIREAQALREVLTQHPRLVLATGGGTPCFHDNLTVLLSTGLTIWLDVPVEMLAQRLHHAAASRPLLAGISGEAELARQLAATLAGRKQFYARAPLRCAPPACTPDAVHTLLMRYLTTA